MNEIPVVYIAGKYADKTREAEDANTEKARRVAIKVWESGLFAFCPHTNTIGFHNDCMCTWENYLIGDLQFLRRCDAVLMLDNWRDSPGGQIEHKEAIYLKLPIFYSIEELLKWKDNGSKN